MSVQQLVWAQVYASEYLRQRNTPRTSHDWNEVPAEWAKRAASTADVAVENMPRPEYKSEGGEACD